jgi:adenine-specific DNA-methyltransferase
VDDGLLARGRGRGGSIMRVVDADEDEDDGEDAGTRMPTTTCSS